MFCCWPLGTRNRASNKTFFFECDDIDTTPVKDQGDKIPGFRAPGQIATNWELATGAERYEYVKQLQGQDPWEDLHPIHLTQPGTTQNPIIVKGIDPERYIACTGISFFFFFVFNKTYHYYDYNEDCNSHTSIVPWGHP